MVKRVNNNKSNSLLYFVLDFSVNTMQNAHSEIMIKDEVDKKVTEINIKKYL